MPDEEAHDDEGLEVAKEASYDEPRRITWDEG